MQNNLNNFKESLPILRSGNSRQSFDNGWAVSTCNLWPKKIINKQKGKATNNRISIRPYHLNIKTQ